MVCQRFDGECLASRVCVLVHAAEPRYELNRVFLQSRTGEG